MIISHPHPLLHPQSLSLPKKPPLLPHPPQRNSKRIIQIQELLHPHPLFDVVVVPHPHPLAVKSLIIASKKVIVYGISYVLRLVCVSRDIQKVL